MKYDVALLMPWRLLEMPHVYAVSVRAVLPRLAKRVVAYVYADQVQEDYAALLARAGLRQVGPRFGALTGRAIAFDVEVVT